MQSSCSWVCASRRFVDCQCLGKRTTPGKVDLFAPLMVGNPTRAFVGGRPAFGRSDGVVASALSPAGAVQVGRAPAQRGAGGGRQCGGPTPRARNRVGMSSGSLVRTTRSPCTWTDLVHSRGLVVVFGNVGELGQLTGWRGPGRAQAKSNSNGKSELLGLLLTARV